MNKNVRRVLIGMGVLVGLVVFGWGYSAVQLRLARNQGVYNTPEAGMLALADKYYMPDREVKILYAGMNSFDGSKPHVWYVIAEVRASAHTDGSPVGADGCEAPGSFFLQTREGWVHVPEGAFPTFIGGWMELFGWAGPGNPTPSVNWAPDQNPQFCRE